jgi:FdhD protein
MLDKLPILRVTKKGATQMEDAVVIESHLTIVFNNRELVTLLCSPEELEFLAIGFLASEGLLSTKADISKIALDSERGAVEVSTRVSGEFPEDIFSKRLIVSSGGKGRSAQITPRGQAKIQSHINISPADVLNLVKTFVERSELFQATGGLHSAALCDTEKMLLFSEDIGRHNAIDKVFGECILKDIRTDDRIMITSGRISSEILLKVAKRNIPILISKSPPTNLGVKLAEGVGITLIGFARGERMNIYTNGWRVVSHGR